MKTKIRLILHYVAKFFLSIIILAFALLVILKLTLLNEKYMLNQFEKTGYFEKLSESIIEEMSNYIIQSGLDEEVLSNIYTKDMIKKDIYTVITSFYHNQDMKLDTSELRKNLETNVSSYLEKNNIKVSDQDSLDRFVDQMADVYESKINLSGVLDSFKNIMHQIINYSNILLVVLGITILVLALFIRFYLKQDVFAIPFLTAGFLIFIGCYLFKNSIDIQNIRIWSEEVSSFLTSLLEKLLSNLNVTAIILVIVGLIETIILKIIKSQK